MCSGGGARARVCVCGMIGVRMHVEAAEMGAIGVES